MIKRFSMPWTRSEGLLMGYVLGYRYQVYAQEVFQGGARRRNAVSLPRKHLPKGRKGSSRHEA
ncbi:MAG TPA: hypothetical protein VHP35_14785, partial [Terriglobia bacterium]|nr:hypothetical protein [Terriglobia bacterium]